MQWRTFVNIALGVTLSFVLIATYRQYETDNKVDRANQRITAVIACIENPSYNQELFGQCLQDWEDK